MQGFSYPLPWLGGPDVSSVVQPFVEGVFRMGQRDENQSKYDPKTLKVFRLRLWRSCSMYCIYDVYVLVICVR